MATLAIPLLGHQRYSPNEFRDPFPRDRVRHLRMPLSWNQCGTYCAGDFVTRPETYEHFRTMPTSMRIEVARLWQVF